MIFDAFASLLCSKLCRNNWRKPTSQVAGDTCTLLNKLLFLAELIVASIPEVQDPVQDMLCKVWDTEAIRVVYTESEMMWEFLNHVQFHDNCYEVSIPWKEGQFDSPNYFSQFELFETLSA